MGPRIARKKTNVIKVMPRKKTEMKTMEAEAKPEVIDLDESSKLKSIENQDEAEKTIEEKQLIDLERKESQDKKDKKLEIKEESEHNKDSDSEMKGSNNPETRNQEKYAFECNEDGANEKSIAILDEPKQLENCQEMEDAKPEHSAETEVTEEKHLNKNSPNKRKLVDMEAISEVSEPLMIVHDSQTESEDQKDEAMTKAEDAEEDMNTEVASEDTNKVKSGTENESEPEPVLGDAHVTSEDVERKEMEHEVNTDDETMDSLQPGEEGSHVHKQCEEKEVTQSEAETNEEMEEKDHKIDTHETDPTIELETKTKENETEDNQKVSENL